jgi:hypothetical protein
MQRWLADTVIGVRAACAPACLCARLPACLPACLPANRAAAAGGAAQAGAHAAAQRRRCTSGARWQQRWRQQQQQQQGHAAGCQAVPELCGDAGPGRGCCWHEVQRDRRCVPGAWVRASEEEQRSPGSWRCHVDGGATVGLLMHPQTLSLSLCLSLSLSLSVCVCMCVCVFVHAVRACARAPHRCVRCGAGC